MPRYGSDREEVEDAIDSAKDRALKIVDSMIAERNAAVIEARKEGYEKGNDDGYKRGYADGKEDGKTEMREKFYKKEKVILT